MQNIKVIELLNLLLNFNILYVIKLFLHKKWKLTKSSKIVHLKTIQL